MYVFYLAVGNSLTRLIAKFIRKLKVVAACSRCRQSYIHFEYSAFKIVVELASGVYIFYLNARVELQNDVAEYTRNSPHILVFEITSYTELNNQNLQLVFAHF
ncbi:unknown [Acidaminococcus sp. CAG:917]|nr:unknown [Acidaminococcus sp. CAG:917]